MMTTERDRVSRPTSLLLEGTPPQREPLKFDVQLVGAPPEVEQLVNNIKQVAEDFLYHWKTFPIVLPQSRFTDNSGRPCDVIIAPPCDELDSAAFDASLEQHPLSPKQLHCIREKGEFEVPSRHFPGQTQVWRVAGWLQRGRAHARDQLLDNVARAAALVLVIARDRLVADVPFSVLAGGKSLLGGLHRLVDLIIGLPSLEARDLEKKIRDDRSRYLVAELICMPEHREALQSLAAWVCRVSRRGSHGHAARPLPAVPYKYTTPQRTEVDLRLYRRETLRRASPALQSALERESRGWFLHYRERMAAELAMQKMPLKDIEEEVRAGVMREYVSRVCGHVRARPELAALGGGVPALLADQLLAAALHQRAEEGVRRKLEAGLSIAEAKLSSSHPVLSRSSLWRREQLAAAEARLTTELRWTAMEDAAAAMNAHKLYQHTYFLMRDLAFLRDLEPLLMKELRAAKVPTREFKWATRIWRPQNWRVTRHFRGKVEKIPTVISTRATSIVTPRSDPSQPIYVVDKEKVRTTATRWPGWRLVNLAHRWWCWCCNVMLLLGVVVPWSSPVGARSLLCVAPVVPDYELSQVNGTLFPKRSSEIQTMWSRLLQLWRHVSKERTRFETEPDTGLLGKGLSRVRNRAWNYVIIGGLCSAALLLVFPLVVVICCVAATLAAAAAPLWTPVAVVALHVGSVLVYDVDCPDVQRVNRWFPLFEVLIWRIGVLGVLQSIAAFLFATLLCPLAALLLLIAAGGWYWLVRVWEAVTWRALIRRGARVPHHDSAFCKRVVTNTDTLFYRLSAAQALCALCARAETEALQSWAQDVEAAIEKPLRDYRHFVEACFSPFSVQISKTGAYKQLEKECSELTASLREKVSARKRDLALGLSDTVRARVRLTADDLRCTLYAGGRELSRIFAAHANDEEWWGARGVALGDWTELAANLLAETLDAECLFPLAAHSAHVCVESGRGAAGWAARAGGAPDVLQPPLHGVFEWGGARPRVSPPAMDAALFNPRHAARPPLPAPAAVAILLYNREADNPIPLESELCAEILRTLEDAPDCDDRKVERYRGGGSDECSVASSDDTIHESKEDELPPDNDEMACRVEAGNRAACRWTLTGRGVRLRADLASPEDVTLDSEHHGTSV